MTPTLKAFHGTWASKGNDNSVFPQTFQICWAYSKLAMLWNDLSFSDPCHDIKRSVRSRSAGWNENDIVRWGWLMKITTFPWRSDLECYEPPLRISWQLWNSWCGKATRKKFSKQPHVFSQPRPAWSFDDLGGLTNRDRKMIMAPLKLIGENFVIMKAWWGLPLILLLTSSPGMAAISICGLFTFYYFM